MHQGEWLFALPWCIPAVGLLTALRRSPILSAAPKTSGTLVSIIVPARNESATIDTLLPSLLATDYSPVEILVVDDRSTDDTPAKVARWAATDARVRLLSGAQLPDGWMGKPWACAQGAEAANGELLVFTDADTTHAAALLSHAVAALQRDKVDLLTLAGHLECVTFWERLVMPQIGLLLGVRYAPERVNRATRPWGVVANGQFILIPKAIYQALGGHRSVRREIVEDLALAQHCVREGYRLRMYHATDLFSTRMYRSLGEMVEGWSKNLYLGARQSLPPGTLRSLAPVALVLAFLFWLVPIAALGLGFAPTAALIAIGASLIVWAGVSVMLKVPPWYALLYPLGALTALWIVFRSIIRGGRKVVWRGREYRVNAEGDTRDAEGGVIASRTAAKQPPRE